MIENIINQDQQPMKICEYFHNPYNRVIFDDETYITNAALQSAKLYQDQSLICYFEHT